MDDYRADSWGNAFADVYDDVAGQRADTTACVETLASLANKRSVLELGVGTGRIAIPLALKGCRVVAVDGSEQMLDKLRAKPGANRLFLVCGDLADVPVEGSFELIYVVYNTLNCLSSQTDQVRCFRNVAQRLRPGGAFVVETFIPWKLLADGSLRVAEVAENSVTIGFISADTVRQTLDTQMVRVNRQGVSLHPARYRYVWPSELDLMAQLAGLRLQERWSDWEKRAFTSESAAQISVFTPG
jgi:SAM-dependent methyltransferase